MKEMFLRFGLWSMVMLLMVSSALSVSASASSNVGTAEYQGWLPELTDSRELNTTAIVSGKVFESGGKNPASGAAVHLEVWPNAEELGKMEEGDTFERLPIGKTVADKDGNYTLRIDKSVDTSQLLSVDGTMDVDLVAWTESGYVTYSFSVVTKEEKAESDSLVAQVDLNTGEIIKAMDVNLEINNPSAGSGGTKSSTNAVTWSNGAKLSGVIGIDLSSRTGYATSAKLDYKFKTPGRLCGTHDKPNGSPRRLVMRSL